MNFRGQSSKKIYLTTAAFLAATSYSYGQQLEGPRGPELTFDFGLEFAVDDNEDLNDPSLGTTTRFDTLLGFGFESVTQSQRLTFGANSSLRFTDEPVIGTVFELVSPEFRAGYSRFNRTSRFDFSGFYSEFDLDDRVFTFFDARLNPVDLVVSAGELRQSNFDVRYETGIGGPLNFAIDFNFDDRNFVDTIDPNLFDRTRILTTASVEYAVSEVLTARIVGSYEDFDSEGDFTTDRQTTRITFGGSYAVSPVLDVDASINYTTFETESGGATVLDDDDIGFGLFATRDLRSGTLTGGVERTITTAVARTELSVARDFELPTGELGFGVGYSFADEGEDRFLVSFSAERDLPTGRVTARLSQEAVTDDDDDDILFTRLDLNYNQTINRSSSFGVGLGLARSEEIGPGVDEDITRASLNLSYNRSINRDWDWSVGYRHRLLDVDGSTSNSNAFFTGIDRSFSIRP